MHYRRDWGYLAADISRLEGELAGVFDRGGKLVYQAAGQLLSAGGKRIRPALLLASAQFADYSYERLFPVALALEVIHMASLVHDDVVDNAHRRRGRASVNAAWGAGRAVLVGDYLFAQAFSLVANHEHSGVIISHLSEIIKNLAEGEIAQLADTGNLQQTEAEYLRRVEQKTAVFMSISCQLGARLSGATGEVQGRLAEYGRCLGMAFQITDDCLDFIGSEASLGKPAGSDLMQGVFTLPVIHVLQVAPDLRELIAGLQSPTGETDHSRRVGEIRERLEITGSLIYARQKAGSYLDLAGAALTGLPTGAARDRLQALIAWLPGRHN